MNCRFCGAALADPPKFCPMCGKAHRLSMDEATFAECYDNKSMSDRCEAILASICPDRIRHQEGWKNRPYIWLDEGAAQGPFLYTDRKSVV